MTTIHNLPVELFRDIFKFCDAKSIINIGKTNCFFYGVTKEHKKTWEYKRKLYDDKKWHEMTSGDKYFRKPNGITDCFCCGKVERCVYWGGEHTDLGHINCYYCKSCYFGGGTVWGGIFRGPKYKVGKFLFLHEIPDDKMKDIIWKGWPKHKDIIKN